MAVGKGIGGGYPVSAACLSKEIVTILEGSSFKYAQSHQNDALGASVVKEVISVIRETGLIERAGELEKVFLPRLKTLIDGKIVIEVRGRGLMIALDFRDSDSACYVYEQLLNKGFITGKRGSTLRIDPPLIIAEDEFESFVNALGDAVNLSR